MTDEQFPESLAMLKTAEGQKNAVFACFGSAVQHAQRFEAEVVGLLVACARLEATPLSLAELDGLDNKLQKQTLGALLKRWSTQATIDENSYAQLLTDALQTRNFLIHRYFLERDEALGDEAGRFRLLRELVKIQTKFEEATTLARAITIALNEVAAGTRQPGSGGNALFTITIGAADDQ